MDLKLTYFDVRGRAESVRMVLETAGIPYVDERVGLTEWAERKASLKADGCNARGQLPQLAWAAAADGSRHVLTQSMAILRYVAALGGMYGSDSAPEERARIDEVLELAQELLLETGKIAWDHAPDAVDTARPKIATHLADLEACLGPRVRSTPAGPRVGADALSVADVHLAFALETSAALYESEMRVVAPRLHAYFRDLVHSTPALVAYVKSGRRAGSYTVAVAARLIAPEQMYRWELPA